MKTVVKENANGGKGQVVVKYILDDNGTKRPVTVGDKTFTPDGCGHGIANTGDEDLVFMALIQLD